MLRRMTAGSSPAGAAEAAGGAGDSIGAGRAGCGAAVCGVAGRGVGVAVATAGRLGAGDSWDATGGPLTLTTSGMKGIGWVAGASVRVRAETKAEADHGVASQWGAKNLAAPTPA